MISFQKINDMIDRITRFGTLVASKFTEVGVRLNTMAASIRSLERRTPNDLGLGNVRNYAPSTTKEAATGVNNTTYMTPRRARDYAEENIFGPLGTSFKNAADRLP